MYIHTFFNLERNLTCHPLTAVEPFVNHTDTEGSFVVERAIEMAEALVRWLRYVRA